MLLKHPVGHTVRVRITLVHYSLPPVVGGVEHVVSQHAKLFAAHGHIVTTISATPLSEDTSAVNSPIRQICVPELAARAIQEIHDPGPFEQETRNLVERLSGLFAGEDVVIAHNLLTMPFNLPATSALVRLASRHSETAFISWIHDVAAVNPDYEIPSGAPWTSVREANPGFRSVVVSPLRQRQWCELTGVSLVECPVVPNGVAIAEVLELSREAAAFCGAEHILEKDLVLLHPTRLLRRKNAEMSLQIAAALKAAGLEIALLITAAADPHHAPSAAYAGYLRELRRELGLLEDAHFLGDYWPVTPQNIAGLYRISDAVLFPSRQEGFGIPMLEAALHRVPCFCTDIEPIRSLPGAIPFSPEITPAQVAALIIRRMQQWPANSPRKDVVRNYSWTAIYRKYLAPLLEEVKQSKLK